MSNQRPRKVRMGSSRRQLDRTSLLAHDVTPETQTDPRSITVVDMDSVNPNNSEHGNQLDFKEPISETLHETSEGLAFASEKCGSLIHPPTTFEIEAHSNQSRSVSPKPSRPQKEDMSGNGIENAGMNWSNDSTREQCNEFSTKIKESKMGMLPHETCQKTMLQISKPGDDTQEVSNSSLYSSLMKEHEVSNDVSPLLKQSEHPTQSAVCPLLIEVPNQEEAEQEQITTTPDSHDSTGNSVIVVESQPLLTMQYTLNPGTSQEMTIQDNLENTKRDHIFDMSELGHNVKEKSFSQACDSDQNSDSTAVDASGLDSYVKQTEVASNQERDRDLDTKSSRKKRRMGSSRRIGNQGKGGGGDHSGEIESDFSTDLNKTNKYFETELKVEMKCDSESLEGGTLGTSTDQVDCLLLIPPQSEIKERGSEDIIDTARKETYTGGHIHLSPDIFLDDVDERIEVESEGKSEIVEKMEVIKIPLSKTLAEENNQDITENMSSPYHEENLCRAATEPQEKDISPPGAVFNLSELEHDVKEKTCSQECESEGHVNKEPWELIEDTAREEGEGHPIKVGALQSEYSSASADDEYDLTFLTRSGTISFNDGSVDNPTKLPITELMEPEKNRSANEKNVTLDSKIELKHGYNNDSNITTEFNPQSEDVEPISSNVTLSDSHSIDDLAIESCLSTNMREINPLATVPQHVPSSGEDQCYSVEMFPPTSSQLQDDSEQVGAQTSTGLSHSLGITELGLNKSYLENENENPVAMPEVEYDLPQNSDTAVDASGLDNDVKQTEVASDQEQDGHLDMKSSRKKRRMGSSRRIGNQGKGRGGDHSGEIVESDFSTDLNKTNKYFETELKVEMKCHSESLEGGTLGTSTDQVDCLLLIPPQSEIKERGSEDVIDTARKETCTGGHIHLSPDISLGDVDERKEDESEGKSEIVEKMEVIKIPLSKTLAEENNQDITENMSSPYHEENLCRAATEPQEKDISPPGAVFDLSELEHNIKEKTCSQECESEGHVNKEPWELIEDTAQEEEEGHPIKVGALQSEYSSASADDEYDLTFPTRSGTISFNDGSVDNPTKLPITELMEPEKNQSANEKNVTLDSKIELKHGYNNDSNITTEFNPQSEDVERISSNVTLSDSHSIDDLAVESCLSTNMREIHPLATVPQHVPSSGEDQCYSVEMFAPTGLSHSLGITELGLNKSYLENENENPVEKPEVEYDLPQNSDTAVDASGLDNDVKQTEVASNQEQDGDLDMISSRKKRRMGSSRRVGNQGKRGGGDHSGEIVESDFSTDLNKTNKYFETELKVEMKCDSESLEGGTLGTSTDQVDCLLLIPPHSEIKERGNEEIIERACKEIYSGGHIHLPPVISCPDVDKRKDESEGKNEIVEKMSRPYHEEDLCRPASDPQDKDIRPPGADFLMLVQNSLSKENAPHSLDINSSLLFAPVSDIRDDDDKMDTAGQHQTALSSNVDQISGQGNHGSLPHVMDDDNHILRRRKMGSSRWNKGSETGSQKGSKEAHTTKEDKEIKKDAVLSETISEGPEKVVTAEEEPNEIGSDTHQSMSEAPKIVRRKLGSNNMTGRMTPIQENTKEKKEVESEVSEDRKIFKDELKLNKDNETEESGERSSETDVKPVNTTLSALPIELSNDLHVEGRRRKLGSQRKSRGQHHHDYPPEIFGDHPPPTEPLSRQISGDATLTFDTLNKCDRRANCFNVVMVGSSNVGKTSFMKRIQSGSFSPDFSASIGIDTCIHALPVDGREVMLQIWDTAGQERFHSISKQIFHKGQAFLLMYDITSSVSFTDVRYWINCIQESAGEEVIMLLLGNKSDCAGREVTPSEGKLLAKEYNIDFNECSAATGEHIVSSIESLARKLTENYHKIEEDFVLQQQPKKRCC